MNVTRAGTKDAERRHSGKRNESKCDAIPPGAGIVFRLVRFGSATFVIVDVRTCR